MTSDWSKPARKVITRAMPWTKGRYMSDKGHNVVDWESQLEQKFCRLLEFDPVVISYHAQPQSLRLPPGYIRRKYTPDFGVFQRNGRFIYEVKPYDIATSAEWEDMFSVAREQLADSGIQFEVRTDRDIDREPLISNIEILLGYRREPVTEDTVVRACDWLSEVGPVSVEQFAEHFDASGRGVALAYFLLATHRIAAKIDKDPVDLDLLIGR